MLSFGRREAQPPPTRLCLAEKGVNGDGSKRDEPMWAHHVVSRFNLRQDEISAESLRRVDLFGSRAVNIADHLNPLLLPDVESDELAREQRRRERALGRLTSAPSFLQGAPPGLETWSPRFNRPPSSCDGLHSTPPHLTCPPARREGVITCNHPLLAG